VDRVDTVGQTHAVTFGNASMTAFRSSPGNNIDNILDWDNNPVSSTS
jgi:hypothetical protein